MEQIKVDTPDDIPEHLAFAYLEGFQARESGIYNNPYPNILPLKEAWKMGWNAMGFELLAQETLEEEDSHYDPFEWRESTYCLYSKEKSMGGGSNETM